MKSIPSLVNATLCAALCYAGVTLADSPAANDGDPLWQAIATRADAAPKGRWSAERAAMLTRDTFKAYYATLKDWTPPPPPAASEGHLINLPDTPKQPRFPLKDKDWPGEPGAASICLWQGDKTAAFSFSIDDNNAPDVPFWMALSKKYGGLNITWNLITDNIGGVFIKSGASQFGTWDLWKQVMDQGGHIASHSVTHVGDPVKSDGWPGPAFEAAESQKALDTNLPGHKATLFAYPGSALKEFNNSATWRPEVSQYFASARGGSGNPINIANQIDYYDIRTTSHPESILDPADWHFKTFNIKNILTPSNDAACQKYFRGWATIFIHGANGGKDWGETPATKAYNAVFDWATQHCNEIWIGYLDDVALYGQERDTAEIKTLHADDQSIEIELTSQMEPSRYNYPLTLKIALPDALTAPKAEQAGQPLGVTTIEHAGKRFALVDAVPNKGQITLKIK